MKPWPVGKPRPWQDPALLAVLGAFAAGTLSGSVVYACTGSGKSIHLAETLAHLLAADPAGAAIVVSTPTVALVDQLHVTLTRRLLHMPGGAIRVGRYYTHASDTRERVIVVCHPSMPELVRALADAGRRVAWWLADECHRTDSPVVVGAYAAMLEAWPDLRRVGWSATPYLSDARVGLRLWEREIVRYTPTDAIRDGALVPWRAVGLTAAQAAAAANGDADQVIADAVVAWVKAQTGPGVVSAADIREAEALAVRLTDASVPALAVHSRQPRAVVDARIEALRTGRLRALVHVRMLVEGVDLPWLQWGALAVPRSRVGFVQEVGRFLRSHTAPDGTRKTHADLYDPHGQFAQHGLVHPSALADLLTADREAADADRADSSQVEMMEITDPLTGRTYKVPFDERLRSGAQRIVWAHSVAGSYIAECAIALRAAQLAGPPFGDKAWRTKPATDRQLEWLLQKQSAMRAITRAGEHGRGIAAAYRMLIAEHSSLPESARKSSPLRAGLVSDFLAILTAARVTRTDTGGWDLSGQERAFAALTAAGVDSAAMIAAGEAATAARKPAANAPTAELGAGL